MLLGNLFGPRYWANQAPAEKKIWDIFFCPIKPKKNFGPIPWQAAEIILATESQSDRHPRVLSIRVGEIFCCLLSINLPTRFACSKVYLILILLDIFSIHFTNET